MNKKSNKKQIADQFKLSLAILYQFEAFNNKKLMLFSISYIFFNFARLL